MLETRHSTRDVTGEWRERTPPHTPLGAAAASARSALPAAPAGERRQRRGSLWLVRLRPAAQIGHFHRATGTHGQHHVDGCGANPDFQVNHCPLVAMRVAGTVVVRPSLIVRTKAPKIAFDDEHGALALAPRAHQCALASPKRHQARRLAAPG